MTDFAIHIVGDCGWLTVDGEKPDLFGRLVGCDIRRELPFPQHPSRPASPDMITPSPAPVVEVTLRLPLGPKDHLTLLRDVTMHGVHGPTEDGQPVEERLTAIARIHRSNAALPTAEFGLHCVHCRFAWPCPTRRALDGDPHATDGNTGP